MFSNVPLFIRKLNVEDNEGNSYEIDLEKLRQDLSNTDKISKR
jgi:hypothetical protein